jgi:hypothetical protein
MTLSERHNRAAAQRKGLGNGGLARKSLKIVAVLRQAPHSPARL